MASAVENAETSHLIAVYNRAGGRLGTIDNVLVNERSGQMCYVGQQEA